MKELKNIVAAYYAAREAGKQTALATLVHVEGSSYRRPGARMLVTEDGELTGAISGGCLEGDALKKALLAMIEGKNKLVTYDTTDEDDARIGVQLGCNGIVHILFEPIDDDNLAHPVSLLQKVMAERTNAVIATLFSLEGGTQYGTCLLYKTKTVINHLPGFVSEAILQDVATILEQQSSVIKAYKTAENCVDAFLQYVPPPTTVVIAGAGNDAIPLDEICRIVGWETVIADGRKSHANAQRFPHANKIIVAKPLPLLEQLKPDTNTVFVLMTHNYNYDIELLQHLLSIDAKYIGVLGPRKKLMRMYDDMRQKGFEPDATKKAKVFGPVGLDIGAETPDEIALSIAAEIKAVLAGRTAASLKDLDEPIHTRISALMPND